MTVSVHCTVVLIHLTKILLIIIIVIIQVPVQNEAKRKNVNGVDKLLILASLSFFKKLIITLFHFFNIFV